MAIGDLGPREAEAFGYWVYWVIGALALLALLGNWRIGFIG